MTFIFQCAEITVTLRHLMERSTSIAVVKRADPEERSTNLPESSENKYYLERYIALEWIRGNGASGDTIEVISPNSSKRVLIEQGTHTYELNLENFIFAGENDIENESNSPKVLFLIDSVFDQIYQYAFKGLLLSTNHLEAIKSTIMANAKPFEKRYAAMFHFENRFDLKGLTQNADQIVMAQKMVPFESTVKLPFRMPKPPKYILPPSLTLGKQRYIQDQPAPYEVHNYRIIKSLRGHYKKGDCVQVIYSNDMFDGFLDQAQRQKHHVILQKPLDIFVSPPKKVLSSDKTFLLFLTNTDPVKGDTFSPPKNWPQNIKEYACGSHQISTGYTTDVLKLIHPHSKWKLLWERIKFFL